jgi:transcriptional regulator with XRE-family HTH domain
MPTRAEELLLRIATNVRALRERRGMTREQLASKTDVDPQLIKRIEAGRANPAIVVLSRLASALMMSVSLIFASDLSATGSNAAAAPSAAAAFDPEVVGETLVSLRHQRNLSRRALARIVNLRSGTLRRYETGQSDARVLELLPLADALAVDSIDLVREMERRASTHVTTTRWRDFGPGVRSRLLSQSDRSLLWELRLEPATGLQEEAAIGVAEEIVTATAGTIDVIIEDMHHTIRNGGSFSVPVDRPRHFQNAGTSAARLLRYQIRA